MLILHAAQVKGSLVLWSEDSEPCLTPPDGQAAGMHLHPYCAVAQVMAEAVSLETSDSGIASAIAWLPSQGYAPCALQPYGGPPAQVAGQATHQALDRISAATRGRGKPSRCCWRATGGSALKPGVAIGTDLAYWTHALRLALSLAVRQQFLPGLTEREGQPVAAWTPVFIGEDAHRLPDLARLMPAPARALTDTETTEPPALAAQAVLREFIAAQVDHLARTGKEPEITGGAAVRLRPRRLAVCLMPCQPRGPERPGHNSSSSADRSRNGKGPWPSPPTLRTGSASGWRSRRNQAQGMRHRPSGRTTGTFATCFSPTTTRASCSPPRPSGRISSTGPTRTSTPPSSC